MAMSRCHSRPERMSAIKREIFRTAGRANLKRFGLRPIQQLLTYAIANDPTFEQEIPDFTKDLIEPYLLEEI